MLGNFIGLNTVKAYEIRGKNHGQISRDIIFSLILFSERDAASVF
jgi:hypothetical protein